MVVHKLPIGSGKWSWLLGMGFPFGVTPVAMIIYSDQSNFREKGLIFLRVSSYNISWLASHCSRSMRELVTSHLFTVRKQRAMGAGYCSAPCHLYIVQDPSQGMVLPMVGRSSHLWAIKMIQQTLEPTVPAPW